MRVEHRGRAGWAGPGWGGSPDDVVAQMADDQARDGWELVAFSVVPAPFQGDYGTTVERSYVYAVFRREVQS